MVTWHRAFWPHEPGHGSTQRPLTQACVLAHSCAMVHSGRQLGGAPRYVGRHEQAGEPFWLRHCAFGPHGDG